MFVVGIYSGSDKLGEGFGSSLKMAEFRAAEDSLHRLYLTQQPLDEHGVPSSTLEGDIYDPPEEELVYNPPPMGHPEVLLGSSERTGSGIVTKIYDDHPPTRTSSVAS
jgi:large subunit ribosomal protein L44